MVTETETPKRKQRRRQGDPALLEQLSDPWRLVNAPASEVREALAGQPEGEVNALLEAVKQAKAAIRERAKTGQAPALTVQQQTALALVGAGLATSLQENPQGPLAGLEQAALYLLALAQAGWKGNLYVCRHCGRIGPAKSARRLYCGPACLMAARRAAE